MAGGASDPGLTDSVLEVPTYIIALVFLFFLVVSIAFEKGVHYLGHLFEKWGRVGLVEALEKLVMEVTLLGFISLLLLTFQSSLSKMCVSYSPAMVEWTMMNNIDGCPCCLQHTSGVSTCAQIEHGCFYNVSDSYAPYCDCGQGSPSHYECNTYREAEFHYFISQLEPTIALTTRVMHVLHGDNETVEAMCDLYCDIANATWDDGTLSKDLASAAGGNTNASGGRRLQGLEARPMAPVGGQALPPWGDTLASAAGSMLPLPLAAAGHEGWEARAGPRRLQGEGAPAQQEPQPAAQSGGSPEYDAVVDAAVQGMIQANKGKAQGGTHNKSTGGSETEAHVVPKVKTFECTGPFLTGSCHEGQVPVISNTALHQVHIWVFLIAITHVVVAILMILLAGYRLRQWRKWQVEIVREEESIYEDAQSDDGSFGSAQHSPPGTPSVLKAASGASLASRGSGRAIELELEAVQEGAGCPPQPQPPLPSPPGQPLPASPALAPDEAKRLEEGQGVAQGTPVGAGLAREGAGAAGGARVVSLSGASLAGSGAAAAGGGLRRSNGDSRKGRPVLQRQLSRQATLASSSWHNLRRKWGRRSTMVRSSRDYTLELTTILLQAFLPNMVRKHQFLMIRSAYIACADPGHPSPCLEPELGARPGDKAEQHAQHQHFDFVSHMLLCLERDAARVVGISLEMWVIVILWVLLAGLGNWSGMVFLWCAAALLLAVDLCLVAMTRYACRGSHPVLLRRRRRMREWLRAEAMLVPIRVILFLCSLLYSTTIFFAWQFGGQSCFFCNQLDLLQTAPGMPWWTGLIFGTAMLLWVSLVTIPAYSLAVHATREEDKKAEVDQLSPVARTLVRQMSLAHQASHRRNQAEISALHAENERLKRMLRPAADFASGRQLAAVAEAEAEEGSR